METCPRCTLTTLLLAVSRTDNKTMVCPACGTHEAVQQQQGHLSPQTAWPVDVEPGYYSINQLEKP